MADVTDIKKDYAKDWAISSGAYLKNNKDSKAGNYIVKIDGIVEEKRLTDLEFYKIWFDFIWYNKKEVITTIKISD